MTLYILKLFADERKLLPCDVAGYYTSKTALIKEMRRRSDEIGEVWSSVHGVKTLEDHAKFDFRYFDSDLANISIVETDTRLA